MEKRYCRRCLLDKVFEKDEYNNMKEYIGSIAEHLKSDKELYENRLNICRKCDNLINGMCRVCGCFVEVRAAVKKNYCPHQNKYW